MRSALTLATILTQPVHIQNIRAGRKNPGLAAQHLTAVRAAALICEARVRGDTLGSTRLIFEPESPPVAGFYEFNVAEARSGGSAGAATLVLQTVLLPLALANSTSTVTIKGGTHVPWSPSFHYINNVYLPALAQLGVQATVDLHAWGWYPAGGGEITATIHGPAKRPENGPIPGRERGALKQISGLAVASSLPAHIAQRMAGRAANLLKEAGLPARIEPQRVRSASPGAGIFLTAEYEAIRAGFSALGKKGKPSEQVAEEAIYDLLAFHQSGATLDRHLTDQLILPLALAGVAGPVWSERLSQHTLTNIWLAEQFLGPLAQIDRTRNLIQFTESRRAWF